MVADSTKKKPRKPTKDFPLFPHDTGRWAKKIRGQTRYFGPWDDPQAALRRYLNEKDYFLAGLEPPTEDSPHGITIRSVCNHFLEQKQSEIENEQIKAKTFQDLVDTAARLIDAWSPNKPVCQLRPKDFAALQNKWAREVGTHRLKGRIQRTKQIFKWAYESDLIEKPLKFGPNFKGPSAREKRKARVEKGRIDYSAKEIRLYLEHAKPQMRAMILLAINCGFGNTDCAELKKDHIDWRKGWVDYARPKTFIERRCKLWPETLAALKELVDNTNRTEKEPEYAALVFLTQKQGTPWIKERQSPSGKWYRDDSIAKEFKKLQVKLKLLRAGRTFYGLRHTFATVAGDSCDQVAVNKAMGHVDETISAHYREGIADTRLEKIADFVHQWLFSKK